MKKTLQMTITPGAAELEDEVRFGEDYALLANVIRHEIGHDVRSCEHWLEIARLALAVEPQDSGYGNAWCVEADATNARFHNAYAWAPGDRFEMPTPLLLEALERWLAHLLAQGYTRVELVDE